MSSLRPVPFLARPSAAGRHACLRQIERSLPWRVGLLLKQQQQQQHRQAQSWVRPRHTLPVAIAVHGPIRAYSSTPSAPAPTRSRFRRAVAFVFRAIFSFALGCGVVVAASVAVTVYRLRALPEENPLVVAALNEPSTLPDTGTDTDTPDEGLAVRRYLAGHPLVAALEADPRWQARHPHRRLPHVFRKLNLTAGTLIGPGRLAVAPLMWVNEGGGFAGVDAAAADTPDVDATAGERPLPSLVMVTHLGKGLCGHPQIVHGGLVATLLDESLARCCFGALPGQVGMTAYLHIDYRAPTPAGGCVALYAQTVKASGRKALVRGRLETLPAPGSGEKAVVLAEAEGLFVSPRNAWIYGGIANLFQ